MRLFVAIPLPQRLRRELVRETERLAGELPAARWVPAANLHLTLRFLGEVAEEELDSARSALRRATEGTRAFEVTLAGRGRFPPRGRPRILWVGLEASDQLAALAELASRTLEAALDIEPERRSFHAHVTVARCRSGWRRDDAERWVEAGSSHRGEVVPVTCVDLMESRLASSGATYHRVERCILEP